MSEDLEPLENDVLAVLRQAKPACDVPPAARSRVWNAVAARLAMVPSGGGGDAAARVPPRSSMGSFLGKNPWTSMVGAMLVGGAIGATLRGAPEVRVVNVERVVPASASSSAATSPHGSAWTEVEVPQPSSVAAPAPRPTASSPTVSDGQELAAESAILDVARAAIARGEAEHALAAVERHASAFPHGVLREEREALGIKALVLAGRADEARARAAKFRARYPESLFLPALESSLRSIP